MPFASAFASIFSARASQRLANPHPANRLARLPVAALALFLVLAQAASSAAPAAADPANPRYGFDWVHPPAFTVNNDRGSHATAIGAKWDRFPFYWTDIQPTADGPLDFSKLDAIVAADASQGVAVQGILLGAPAWATAGGHVDLDRWASFVGQTVSHYRGQVGYWEIWNEPDLLDGSGNGRYWTYGPAAYAELLRAGYKAAKAADPSVTVLMGAIAFPYNNEGFFGQFLDALAQDGSAAANGYYFDVLPFHSYDRVARLYDLPLGYFGKPSYEGFHAAMRRHGFDKPLWANETGVPVWDYGSGQKAPGRATQDEQSTYIIQSAAYAQAAGVDKYFYFQMSDDGAGAVDPATNRPAEYFGLFANDGAQRPGYLAYQTAISYFGDSQLTTRVNTGRNAADGGTKGAEAITFYGTSHGRVTVAWNADGGGSIIGNLPATTATAQQIDRSGRTIGKVAATNGTYSVTLLGATNNSNFDCFTPHGCDPNDYIIGGTPVILVEDDSSVPSAVLSPLATASNSPVTVTWRTLRPSTGAVFDVQFMDTGDGNWRDWQVGTTATTARFGEGDLKLQRGHTYQFRARAHDSAGSLLGGDYPPGGMASTLVVGGNVLGGSSLDGKIEVVWPHDNQPVDKATQVNISGYLFAHGSTISVSPNSDTTPTLYRSLNNGVEEVVGPAKKRLVTKDGKTYPAFDFNDVDVSAARDAKSRYFFRLSMGSKPGYSNTWSHGSDSRTYFPKTDVPTGLATVSPSSVDAKIEIVWPHDNKPVDQATQVNIGVSLFEHGSLSSVPASFDHHVQLLRSLNNGVAEEVGEAKVVLKTESGLTYPTWQFNDIDVAAARDPKTHYFFRVAIDGVTYYSNTWAHGKDGRTYFPAADVPSGVAP